MHDPRFLNVTNQRLMQWAVHYYAIRDAQGSSIFEQRELEFVQVRDHKGELEIHWFEHPNFSMMDAAELAWGKVGELTSNVIHQTYNLDNDVNWEARPQIKTKQEIADMSWKRTL